MRRLLTACLPILVALSGSMIGNALAQTPPRSETSSTFAATEDTWVDQGEPDAAHGDEDTLRARLSDGVGSRILVGFDLDGLKGAEIRSAVLRLHLESGTGAQSVQIAASGIKGPWDEQTTWSTQPERTSTYPIVDIGTTATEVEWDVTTLLQENVDLPAGLHGIALNGPVVGTGEAYERTFASSESDPAPELRLTYVPAAKEDIAPPPGASQVRWVIVGISVAAIAVIAVLLIRRRGKDVTNA